MKKRKRFVIELKNKKEEDLINKFKAKAYVKGDKMRERLLEIIRKDIKE